MSILFIGCRGEYADFAILCAASSTAIAHPNRPLKLLHTSDVHLESDTFGHGAEGKKLRDSHPPSAFSQVVSTANRLDADLLLIVGDLFDSSRITDEALSFALGQIARARMPVVMTLR